MGNITVLINKINALVDEYYEEQRRMCNDSEQFIAYHMRRKDGCGAHILGIRDAINLLGYEVKFSDDMYPFSHVSDIVKTEYSDEVNLVTDI